jgi:hypothetical protein
MSVSYSGTVPAPWLAKAVREFGGDFNYIWNVVAPTLMSKLRDGTIGKRDREKIAGDGQSTRRAPGSAFDRDKIALNPVTFNVKHYGKEVPLAEEDIALYATLVNAQMAAGEKIRNDIFVDAETRVKSLLFNTTTWTGSALFSDNKAAPWSTAGSDIQGQVVDAKEAVRIGTGMHANALIVNQATWLNMVNTNTAFKGYLSGLNIPSPDAMRQTIEQILELKIVVGDAIYNSAIEGQTFSGSNIWDDGYAMVAKIAMTNRPDEACVARSVAWEAMGAGTDMKTEIYREPQTKSQVVQGSMDLDEIVIDPAFGHLMQIEVIS